MTTVGAVHSLDTIRQNNQVQRLLEKDLRQGCVMGEADLTC